MRKYWVHYSYAKGKKHIRTVMEADNYRAIITEVRKIRRDAVVLCVKDMADVSSTTILTMSGA